MPQFNLNIEYKHRHLTRPMLQQIILSAMDRNADELIVRCKSTAKTALDYAEEASQRYGLRITIIPNVE